MTTDLTRATPALRMPEFDQRTIEMNITLVDDILDRITAAYHPAELDGIVRDMWVDHTNGLLAESQMEVLDEAARTRREAFQERRTETRSQTPASSRNAPRASAPLRQGLRRPQRSLDRQASIERRRRLVASGPLPPAMAARFTWGEVAVMRIIGDECRDHGCCTLHIDAIAARAGVERTTVQNALREGQGRGDVPGIPIITVQERRRRGQRSLTNIVRIVSKEWRDWLHKGPRYVQGVGSKCSAPRIRVHSLKGGPAQKGSPWGVPDGVFSYEEVT
jgi:hypothetical protein